MHMMYAHTVVLAMVVATIALSGCRPNGAGAQRAIATPPSPFATIANGKVDIEGGVIEVAARRFGVIKEVLVQEGDTVKKGQVLARQEDQDTVLAILSAKAAVAQAESQ